MSGIQSPQILTDLYRDLRDRRLLPLVLVLVVGMAVVPMALSSKNSAPAPVPAPAPVAHKSNAPATAVVVSDPGVRDFHRRLRGDAPKNPFKPVFKPLVQSSGSGASPSTGSSGTSPAPSGTSGSTTAGTTSTGTTAPSGGTFTAAPKVESKFFFYRVKIRSGQVGGAMKVQDNVKAVTSLPSKAVPAVAFLGVTTDSSFHPQTAVFLVSSSVSLITGTGKCSFAGTQCQLLSLKPGEYADLTWTDGLTYRVMLEKFELVSRNGTPSSGGNGNPAVGRKASSSSANGKGSGSTGPLGHRFSF